MFNFEGEEQLLIALQNHRREIEKLKEEINRLKIELEDRPTEDDIKSWINQMTRC